MTRSTAIFQEAAHAWEARGIQSICFKSAGIPPSYPYTSENFDILFQPGDERGAREALTELGYVLLANCDEPQKWLYRLFVGGKSVSAIHLHTRVGWGQGFMLEDEIWQRARPSKDDPVTWIPGPEDVILINAAHCYFENKAFGLHDLLKIRRAIADGADWDRLERVTFERGWLPALQFALAMMARLEQRIFETPLIPGERFERPAIENPRMQVELERAQSDPARMQFPTSWKLVKILFFDKIKRDRREAIQTKPILVFLTLARGMKSQLDARPQNSGLFTLSGIDGSGKTAQAEALSDAFNVCHLRRRVIWGRLGATPAMHRMSRLWSGGGSAASHLSDSLGGRSTRSERGGVPKMIWAVLSSLDFAAWLVNIRYRLLRGDIVIADRYVCDYDVELSLKLERNSRLRSLLLGAIRLLAPKPARGFLLDVDASTARARALPDGGDFNPETGTRLYRGRADSYDLTTVDATQPFEAVSAVVERQALRTYFNRYGMWSNSIYFQNPFQLNRPVRKQEPEVAGSTQPVFMEAAASA